MTDKEAEKMITDALNKQSGYDISFQSLIITENTIRAAVTYKQHGDGSFSEHFKEILILRTAGQWRVLI